MVGAVLEQQWLLWILVLWLLCKDNVNYFSNVIANDLDEAVDGLAEEVDIILTEQLDIT